MRVKGREISADDLAYARASVHYCPATGIFTRIGCPKQPHLVGKPAGGINKGSLGYLVLELDNRIYKGHRLAWALMFGGISADMEIDHIDGDRANNKLSNLRLVDRQTNNENIRKPSRNNTTGFLGVSRTRHNRFHACIRVDNKLIGLGNHSTPEEAYAVYLEAKRKWHKGNTL